MRFCKYLNIVLLLRYFTVKTLQSFKVQRRVRRAARHLSFWHFLFIQQVTSVFVLDSRVRCPFHFHLLLGIMHSSSHPFHLPPSVLLLSSCLAPSPASLSLNVLCPDPNQLRLTYFFVSKLSILRHVLLILFHHRKSAWQENVPLAFITSKDAQFPAVMSSSVMI